MRNKIVLNITLSALMIGLGIIFERLIVINIPPFIRIGIGSIPVILASVIIGPLYGALIGASVDVLGYFIFDVTGYPYTPYVTISFILIGVLPYLLFKASAWMRYKKNPFPVSYILLAVIWSFLTAYVIMADSVRISGTMVAITQFYKIFIPIVSFFVFAGFSVFIYLINRHFQKKILFYPKCPSPHQSAFVILVMEIVVHMVWGSIWKAQFFGLDPMMVLFIQAVILIFTFPVKTAVLNYVLIAYHRYIDKARSDHVD
ncbi:MAG: folate family ECF transporter S component [Bacilli bacterium]